MTRGLLLVVLAAALSVIGSSPAVADDSVSTMIDASPGVDAVVVRPPEEIALSFRYPVSGIDIRLFKDGVVIASAEANVDETLAVARVEAAGSGSYLVDWKGTDATGAPIAGAYVFVVDPRGNNSIAVDREITGASGALGGLRVIAAAVAAVGVVALLVAGVGRVSQTLSQIPARHVGMAALLTGVGSLMAGATYGVPADGSLRDLFDVAVLSSAAASGPGRAWLTAALLLGVMPFVLVLGRSSRPRWAAGGAVTVAAVVMVWVAMGLGWLMRLPWPLLAFGLATATALVLSIDAGRPVAAGIALVVLLAFAVPFVSDVRGSGASSATQAGDLLVEVALDPARSGVNELHVYGFDTLGRSTALGSTSVVAYHPALNVGPLELPVLRAGPNHFLSYRATLPLTGDWTLNVTARKPEGGEEPAAVEMHLQ